MSPADNARARRRGKDFERSVKEYVRRRGFDYDPLRMTGTRDEGDGVIRLDNGTRVVVEAKNTARLTLAEHVGEARLEAKHYAEHRDLPPETVIPVLFQKRRGLGTGKSYAVMEVDDLMNLLSRVA